MVLISSPKKTSWSKYKMVLFTMGFILWETINHKRSEIKTIVNICQSTVYIPDPLPWILLYGTHFQNLVVLHFLWPSRKMSGRENILCILLFFFFWFGLILIHRSLNEKKIPTVNCWQWINNRKPVHYDILITRYSVQTKLFNQ